MDKPGVLRLVVCGSREWPWRKFFDDALAFYVSDYPKENVEIVEGECRGPDLWARAWAEANGYKFKPFPADWDGLGKGAGFIRNGEMAEYGNATLAFWDGVSGGTTDMIEKAKAAGHRVRVLNAKKILEQIRKEQSNGG